MKSFKEYIDHIDRLAFRALDASEICINSHDFDAILDGEVASQFRHFVPLETRKSVGAFFTGSELAKQVVRESLSNINSDAIIADPACGLGDLLLAAATALPTGSDIAETLNIWSSHLLGFEIQEQFIRATKARLLLLAIRRSPRIGCFPIRSFRSIFPMIYQCDFLACPGNLSIASHIMINPPYNQVLAPAECTWGNRKISAAALFMDTCLTKARTGAKITAILPDVLRSGSCYEKWRHYIESQSEKTEIITYGQFDKWTDVHVFLLKLTKNKPKRQSSIKWWKTIKKPYNGRVGDYFYVHVGPVVPFRNLNKGPSLPFIHAKTLPAWGIVHRIYERRRFNGTMLSPPFVAVHRTSRPGDNRAIATIITGKRKVAVENHLLALLPHKKNISKCRELVQVLKSPQTDQWLNNRIRCRHLTVRAIIDLPWWQVP